MILKFIKSEDNYIEVTVGNNNYNLMKGKKIQITDVTVIIYPNTGRHLLLNWIIKCSDKKWI